jgi:hypothetical protein
MDVAIKASWPEMNPQTMLANFVAVLVEALLLVYAADYSWTTPINYGNDFIDFRTFSNNLLCTKYFDVYIKYYFVGIMGSCSTVSTLFAEIHTLYYEKGTLVSLRYV